jgi:hypothetical protein
MRPAERAARLARERLRARAREVDEDVAGARVAVLPLLREEALDDARQCRRQAGLLATPLVELGGARAVAARPLDRRVGGIGVASVPELEEDDAERVEVAGVAGRLAGEELGGEPRQRAAELARRADHREPEVDQHDARRGAARLDDEVRGLEIAVDDAALGEQVERAEEVGDRGELALERRALERAQEVDAAYRLRREEERAVGRVEAEIERARDAGVVERAQAAELVAREVAAAGGDALERDGRPAQDPVAHQQDRRGHALTEDGTRLVPPGNPLSHPAGHLTGSGTSRSGGRF